MRSCGAGAVVGTPLTGGQASIVGTPIGAPIIQFLLHPSLPRSLGCRGSRRYRGGHRGRGSLATPGEIADGSARAMIPQRTPAWAHGASLLQWQGGDRPRRDRPVRRDPVWRDVLQQLQLLETLRNNSYFALIALGMTFVVMMGGIDLSVGSVVALSAVVAARLSPKASIWSRARRWQLALRLA